MSASMPEAPAAPRDSIRGLAAAARDFWFKPGDPTVLGLLRICCGLVLVWAHVLMGLQLQELYGPDGLYDLKTADVLRKQSPSVLPPDGWGSPEAEKAALYSRRSELSAEVQKLAKQAETDATVRPQLEAKDRELRALRPPEVPGMSKQETIEYRKLWGMDPSEAHRRGLPQFSVWFHLTGPRQMAVAHAVMLLVLVLFTLGVGTRVTSVLSWLIALSYIHRASMATFGFDTMVAVLLLYLMIAPCGAALSVDRLIARYRVARLCLEQRRPIPLLRPAPRVSATLALRLLQVHFCIIYLASGTSKLQGPAWWDGTALWQTMANYEFAGPRTWLATEALRWLARHRLAWEVFFTGGAVFTLVLEASLPFLIWYRRTRWLMICGAVLLHTGIALSMGGLTGFSLLMLTIVGSFIPAETVHRALARVGRGKTKLWLALNPRVPAQERVGGWAHAFDVWGQLRDVDVRAQRPEGLPAVELPASGVAVVTEEGEVLRGRAALARVARALRLLWPLAAALAVVGLVWRRESPPGPGAARPKEAVGATVR
jgi:hypothetical protein